MLFSDTPENHHTSIKHGLNRDKIKVINAENIETIRQEISGTCCNNIIYSGESVAAFTKSELDRIKLFFNDLIPEANLYVLISTRNPIDYITSFVQQRRRTSIGYQFDFNYAYKFGKLIDVFGKDSIIAFKFEDACCHVNGPVGYFLNLIGICNEDAAEFKIINSNSSISDKAIDIIDFVNKTLPMLSDKQITEGRIHLDYSHFYQLTGNKFQLGKDFFDEYVSMEKMSQSCKWLKDNMDIEYSVKDIPERKPRIIYDQLFAEEIKDIYTWLTPVLKKLTHEYFKERIKAAEVDDVSKKQLRELLQWAVSEQKEIEDASLGSIIKTQRALIAKDKKYRDQLLKRFKGDDIRAGQFLRDIALFLEHYGMIEQSYYFMGKAKMYAPTVALINSKLKEYQDDFDI